jgi:hypothetical protein
MPKVEYITWSQSEEDNLSTWMSQHCGLPWKIRSEEYFRQMKIPRSVSSLRSKLRHLSSKGRLHHQRDREPHSNARRARHIQQRDLQAFPKRPQSRRPKAPHPKTRMMSHPVQRPRPSELGSSPLPTNLDTEDYFEMSLEEKKSQLGHPQSVFLRKCC